MWKNPQNAAADEAAEKYEREQAEIDKAKATARQHLRWRLDDALAEVRRSVEAHRRAASAVVAAVRGDKWPDDVVRAKALAGAAEELGRAIAFEALAVMLEAELLKVGP